MDDLSPQGMLAGVGRVDITPPLPIDLVGYSRRSEPATDIRTALTVTTLVLASEQERVAIVAADLPLMTPVTATLVRKLVASAVDTNVESVLVNVSHTHAGPITDIDALKIGGRQRERTDLEKQYVAVLPHLISSSAVRAVRHLQPARVGSGIGSTDLTVNRRERTDDGKTILGWNPDGACDREVGVLRVDRANGSPLALVVVFGCHPVVVGPEDPAVNADFPSPMRDFVEQATGATCLFLQGAGGNVLPLEGFFADHTPAVRFGERLGVEALSVAANIETTQTEIQRLDYGSVTPIHLYRKRPVDPQPEIALSSATTLASLPLKRVPARHEIEEQLESYRAELQRLTAEGADRSVLNPAEYHVNWAERALSLLDLGGAAPHVDAVFQAIRIGDVVISAIPGEVFSEISLAIKARSPATHTLVAGYSNGVLSYLPPASEFPFGGYECDYAHHSYGLIEQVAPESEHIIVESSLALIERLWID